MRRTSWPKPRAPSTLAVHVAQRANARSDGRVDALVQQGFLGEPVAIGALVEEDARLAALVNDGAVRAPQLSA
jgi:hypothetical protein